MLNISRAWEMGDASASAALMSKLSVLVGTLNDSNKSGKKELMFSSFLVCYDSANVCLYC